MEQMNDAMGMLDLVIRPGFCVKDHKIVKANRAAQCLQIAEGADIAELLRTGKEEYSQFQGACLYLTLELNGRIHGASVTRMGEFDVFLLDLEDDHAELQAMALAARELREPLANVITSAERLFPLSALEADPAVREQAARLNRGLFQLMRIIGNMSDAGSSTAPRQEIRDLPGFLDEVFAKASALVSHTGKILSFQNQCRPVYSLMEADQLERAVLNIISNAVKFTPEGGTIDARLIHRGKMLYLSIHDSGEGIPDQLRSSVYSRYQRQPALEDGRYGIGLGLVLVRSIAARHGGTVLIDHPNGSGTQITVTLAIRQDAGTAVRSPMVPVDYTGGWDRGLIELSDALPEAPYDPRQVN